jgi:hypothetical protein
MRVLAFLPAVVTQRAATADGRTGIWSDQPDKSDRCHGIELPARYRGRPWRCTGKLDACRIPGQAWRRNLRRAGQRVQPRIHCPLLRPLLNKKHENNANLHLSLLSSIMACPQFAHSRLATPHATNRKQSALSKLRQVYLRPMRSREQSAYQKYKEKKVSSQTREVLRQSAVLETHGSSTFPGCPPQKAAR